MSIARMLLVEFTERKKLINERRLEFALIAMLCVVGLVTAYVPTPSDFEVLL